MKKIYSFKGGLLSRILLGLGVSLLFSIQLSSQTVLFSEDFSSCTGNAFLPQGNWVEISTTTQNTWYIASSSCNINGNSLSVADNGSNACSFTDNKASNIIAYRTTGNFTTSCHSTVTISFNYKVGGSANDYGMVVYCTGDPGTFANWVPITTGGDGTGKYYNVTSVTASSVSLPAGALNQSTVYIGFKWYNDATKQQHFRSGNFC